MDKTELQIILENDREWRQYMIEKVDRIDKELSTFKLRVFALSVLFGSLSGAGTNKVLSIIFN